ncbi:MAG: hypothetical protein ACLQVY_12565 [Limisphaerales bacterium]
MDRFFHRWARGFRAVTFAAALGSLFGLGYTLSAADSPPPATTVALEYTEMDYTPAFWGVPITERATPFKKEPPAASGKTIRGVLNFGGEASNSIPFLWQRDAGKLFLDLNRNEDLTDDPQGALSATGPLRFASQTFRSIHLTFATKCDKWTGLCAVLADLNMWGYAQQLGCSVGFRSLWEAKLDLQGKVWQVGIVPSAPAPDNWFAGRSLLLRPWENGKLPFSLNDGSLDALPFSPSLFLDGGAYAVALVDSVPKSPFQPCLRLVPQSFPLGELKITGQFIQRLLLPGGPALVVLNQPAETVKVPVGRYRAPEVQLGQNGSRAVRSPNFIETESGTKVTATSTAVIVDGGPLTNRVIVNREGRDLRFDYRLIGANEQPYKFVGLVQQPEWSVFRGEKKIASGKFEFG